MKEESGKSLVGSGLIMDWMDLVVISRTKHGSRWRFGEFVSQMRERKGVRNIEAGRIRDDFGR